MQKLNEDKLIKKVQELFPSKLGHYLGIGDDAAVIYDQDQNASLISKDLLIEDVHFRLNYAPPAAVAHKAIHTNISDIAAMGGKPKFLLLGLAVPSATSAAWINKFLATTTQICRLLNIALIGGDTTRSASKLFISITAIGIVYQKFIKYRSTAQVGDLICLSGSLGEAYMGFLVLDKHCSKKQPFKNLIKKQLYPEARLREGEFLGHTESVNAMIDLSDGLALDLPKLCQASGVGACIDLDALPLTSDFLSAAKKFKLDPMQAAISGGEEYELLFTVKNSAFKSIQGKFFEEFSRNLHPIGMITKKRGIHYLQKGKKIILHPTPFQHF